MAYPGAHHPSLPGSQHPFYSNAAFEPSFPSNVPASYQSYYYCQNNFAERPNISQVDGGRIPSVHYVRMLEQELGLANKRIREYESAITFFVSQTFLIRNRGSQEAKIFKPSHSIATSCQCCSQHRLSSTSGARDEDLLQPLAGQIISAEASDVTEKQTDRANSESESSNEETRFSSTPVLNPSMSNDALTSAPSNEPDWSIKYTTEVNRKLEVNLIRTIAERSAFRLNFSPDGHLLAITPNLSGGPVSIFHTATGKRICLLGDFYVRESPSSVQDLCFSPDCQYLATCTSHPENIIRIWEVGKKHVRNVLRGHLDTVYALDFSPDGRHLFSCSYDTTVRTWNMRDGSSRIFYSSARLSTVRSSPDGRHVAAGTFGDTGVSIWELRSGRLLTSLKGHTNLVESIVFTPNGRRLISGSWDGTLKYWNISRSISTPRTNEKCSGTTDVAGLEVLTLAGHTGRIRSISISPDGQWLVSSSDDATICIWSTGIGTPQCILQGHKGAVSSVIFSPVGGYLASADLKGIVRIWSYKAA